MSGAPSSHLYPSFGTDGVRGVAISEITSEYVMALGRAVAKVLPHQRLIIARDTRLSGPVLEAAFSAGAAAQGARVEQLGVLPTPAVALISAIENVTGVVITASHNPFTDNGIKVFAAGGRKLNETEQRSVEDEVHAVLASGVNVGSRSGTDVGQVVRRSDAVTLYVDHIVKLFGEGSLAGLRLVIDTANGAMSAVAPVVLSRLGADVIVMNDAPDGININAECGATSPQSLCDFISGTGTGISVDMGFAYDGDGDRLIAVDENGNLVNGDRMIALSVLDRQYSSLLSGNTVVVTVMTNSGFHRAMRAAGVDVVTTAVGDRYVLEAMESGGFVLGGEQSGHIIHRDMATTGDGLLASIVLAQLARRRGISFSVLAHEVMQDFPQVLKNVMVAVRPTDVSALLAQEIAAEESLLGDHGRVLVRISGTEPLIRVMVEAATLEQANQSADRLITAARARCI